MIYILEKVNIEKGKTSGVAVGAKCTGNYASVFGENKELDFIEDANNIELGDQLVVSSGLWGPFLRCSPIIEILEQDKTGATFKTRSSTYQFTIKE